ncbi:uncharacterized protein LOC141587012 [Silene latifolia]|uniref:uncharacterized protein LOC141587012 n=1 Tax=Silene latifolia TaxID=37657 RepID=UPI003D776B29
MHSLKHHFIHSSPKLLSSSSYLPKLNFTHHSLPSQNYSPPNFKRHALDLRACNLKPTLISSKFASNSTHPSSTSSSLLAFQAGPTASQTPLPSSFLEETLEKVIYRWRFVTLLGVMGSLIGSVLCFVKGCGIVAASFIEHFAKSGKAIDLLVEAIDVYLLGTVMLVFGMGIYELFVSNLDIAKSQPGTIHPNRSNLFGLFTLLERPRWLEIKSVNELKTKVGHVIVMLLLIGLFDKSKKAAINTPIDLVCFSASVLLCSGGLYLLSKLNGSK